LLRRILPFGVEAVTMDKFSYNGEAITKEEGEIEKE